MTNNNKSTGWLAKSNRPGKLKRLTPKRYAGEYVSTPRLDHNMAAAYNMQRSKATVGPREDSEPKLENNFTKEVPLTRTDYGYIFSERAAAQRTRQVIMDYEKRDLFSLYLDWNKGHGKHKPNWFFVVDLDDDYFIIFRGNEAIIVYLGTQGQYISVTYEGNMAAVRAKCNGTVAWRTIEPFK